MLNVMSVPRPTPFYYVNGIALHVLNSKTLVISLVDFKGEGSTGYISLPSPNHVDKAKEKFQFYVVLNYSADDGNEFGLWIYAYAAAFNSKIKGCQIHLVNGRNYMELSLTTELDSVVGIYRSPCYDIVNNRKKHISLLIHLPNMTFETSDLSTTATTFPTRFESIMAATAKAKKLKEVNLSDELSVAYREAMGLAKRYWTMMSILW